LESALATDPALERPANTREKPRRKTRSRPQLLNRQELDRRLNSVQQFDQLVADIKADLAGDLTAIEARLVEAFAGGAVVLDSLNAKVLLGQEVSLAEFAGIASTMVRVASRLGLQRRAKDVSLPDPLRYRSTEDEAA
jgi:hypothetical protein